MSGTSKDSLFSVSVIIFSLAASGADMFPIGTGFGIAGENVSWEIHSSYFHFYYFCLPFPDFSLI